MQYAVEYTYVFSDGLERDHWVSQKCEKFFIIIIIKNNVRIFQKQKHP